MGFFRGRALFLRVYAKELSLTANPWDQKLRQFKEEEVDMKKQLRNAGRQAGSYGSEPGYGHGRYISDISLDTRISYVEENLTSFVRVALKD